MWAAMISNAESGDLSLDPAVGAESQRAASDWLDALRLMAVNASSLGMPEGFPPDLDSAQALAKKFGDKATGADGVQVRIAQFITVGEQLRDLIRAAVKKIETEDEAVATDVESVTVTVPK